jgi:amino acid adenylation domain-containing protein
MVRLHTNSEDVSLLSADANQAEFAAASHAAGSAVPSEWIGRTIPFPRERTVLDFFQAQVQARSEAVAIKDRARLMTYAELDLLSNRVANELRCHALKLEESVVILLPASCEFLAGVLGVLKAGGTYFPVEMDTPTKRLELLLNDSASRLVLSNEAGMNRLHEWSGKVLDLTQVIRPSEAAHHNPGVPTDPNRRAYIIYTSGSTGQPKGVEIEHHALTNLVSYYHRRLKLTAQDRASMLASVAFDASMADIWPVLCAGGTITIPPKGILLNPDGLIEWLAAEEITLTFVPTGLAEILFARLWPERMKLRFLITGGDRLRVRPPAGLPFTVINGYGPTENTVFSTWSVVTPEDGAGQPPSIGRPLDNIKAYVLDEHLQPVSVNVAGELYLGGEQVARGYLGRPELTVEQFVSDAFSGQAGARMYRTGDWVRWLVDGELDFLQRRDGQIQIRGRRVELGEVEATVFDHGKVRQVCCVPWLDEGMPSGVIAHIVPESHSLGLADELRAYLCTRLPDYMMPSEFVLHERLPLTPQGKLDRAGLMALQAIRPESPQIVSSEDGLVQALTRLWHSFLPAAKRSPATATFAALGGDSLLAIKLMLGVEEITGQPLEVSTFLVNPTIGGLCEAVKMRLAINAFEPVLALRKQGTRPAVFCLYALSGDIEYCFNLVEALGDDQPVFGIRSPALEDLSRLPPTMEDAATEVVGWIRKVHPQGVPALVGYSWGGLLAFEVARQLLSTEGIHCYTALIGADAPLRPTNIISRSTHFARHFPRWLWDTITDPKHRGRRLKRWREITPAIKQSLVQARWPMIEPSPIGRHLMGLMENYQPLPILDTTVFVFRERDEDYYSRPHPLHNWLTPQLPDAGWNHWTRRPNHIHWLAGDHKTILKQPAVSELAQSIRRTMDQHFKTP